MMSYLIRRLFQAVPVLLGITVITFLLLYIVPGDPARILAPQTLDEVTRQRMRAHWNLDKPVHIQYLLFLKKSVTFDLGESWMQQGAKISSLLGRALLATMVLTVAGIVVATLIGLVAGVISAVKPYSWADIAAMIAALVGVSTPAFWLAMILILIFSVNLGWFPISGTGGTSLFSIAELVRVGEVGGAFRQLGTLLHHLVLPALTLGAISAAIIARLTRSTMLEVLSADYVRTARAKGVAELAVVQRHALRNALIPIITVIGTNFARLLAGAVLTETVFSWPGLGREMIQAIRNRDQPVVMCGVMLTAFLFVLVNLLVDLTYAWLDPRIRYDES